MKYLLTAIFLFSMTTVVAAQQSGRPQPTLRSGSVYGEIRIKEVSGNNLGNFSCSNLTVNVSKLGGNGWQRKATAAGNFAGRRCWFRVDNVPAGESFVAVLTAQFPHGCDQKNFDTTTSFPMELKSREQLKYDFSVAKIRCVLVK